MEKKFLPEIIKGKRLSLKKHSIELAEKMYQYVIEDKNRLAKFLPWPKYIEKVEDEIEFINRCNKSWDEQEGAHYGLYRNSDDEYMGNVSSFRFIWSSGNCEIGYWILGKFEGSGYMTESVQLLEDTLFNIGFNRIVIRCQPDNVRSGTIPKRLKYHFEGTSREAILVDSEFRDLDVYSKIQRDLT